MGHSLAGPKATQWHSESVVLATSKSKTTWKRCSYRKYSLHQQQHKSQNSRHWFFLFSPMSSLALDTEQDKYCLENNVGASFHPDCFPTIPSCFTPPQTVSLWLRPCQHVAVFGLRRGGGCDFDPLWALVSRACPGRAPQKGTGEDRKYTFGWCTHGIKFQLWAFKKPRLPQTHLTKHFYTSATIIVYDVTILYTTQ